MLFGGVFPVATTCERPFSILVTVYGCTVLRRNATACSDGS